MPPKLKPMAPKAHTLAPKEPEEIVLGNLRVGKDGIVLTGEAAEGLVAPTVHLDDLEKRRALGEGKQGTVSQYVLKTNRAVAYAVKKIPVSSATDPSQIQRLAVELKSIFAQDNEYTIKLYNAFYRAHCLYLIMEYMDWGSLEELCTSQTRLSESVSSYIAGQILHSLAMLHGKKAVVGDGKETRQIHRDIKPANVLLSCDGHVKLADFGVAANADTVGASSFVGTATYMSPERIKGGKHGPLSDIWSVGVVVAQTVMGEYPFQGMKVGFMALLKEVTTFERLDTSKCRGASEEFVDFVGRCLQQKEEIRWTAEQLLEHPWIKAYEKTGKEELKRLLDQSGDIAMHRATTSTSIGSGTTDEPQGTPSSPS